jgi:methionyl-tRNA formyltransferase
MTSKLTTVFFGSGPVAAKSLKLLSEYFVIEAIITKPSTQGTMQQAFPLVAVYTAENRTQLDQLIAKRSFTSQLGILIDFGIIISQTVIDAFPLGIVNSHFSLLPEWRGADPITFAILSGQTKTGVSLMLVTKGMDEGPLLAQAPQSIARDATTQTLTDDLINLSGALIKAVIPEYVNGVIAPAPQANVSLVGDVTPTYSRRLSKEDGKLDWAKPATQLEREIRAYIAWPHSYTSLAGRDVIITQAEVVDRAGRPGEIQKQGKRLFICCGKQALEVLALKPAGKSTMSAEAFLAGYGRSL